MKGQDKIKYVLEDMIHMKKFLAMSLALAMVVSLAACGKDGPAPDKETDDPAGTEIIEQVEQKESPYLAEGEGDDFEKIDGVNHTIFRLPAGMTENTVDSMTYLFTAMAAAFGGEETSTEDAEALLQKDIMDAYNEMFMLVDPYLDYMVTISTFENTEGLTMDDLSYDKIVDLVKELSSSEDTLEGDISLDGDDFSDLNDDLSDMTDDLGGDVAVETPNAPADTAGTTGTTDTADTADTTDGTDGDVDDDYLIDDTTDDLTNIEVGELVAEDDTKVIYKISTVTTGMDADGNEMDVNLEGYFVAVIKDGYFSASILMTNSAKPVDWLMKVAKSIEIDTTNEGSFPLIEDAFGEGLGDFDFGIDTGSDAGTDTTGTDTTGTDTTDNGVEDFVAPEFSEDDFLPAN